MNHAFDPPWILFALTFAAVSVALRLARREAWSDLLLLAAAAAAVMSVADGAAWGHVLAVPADRPLPLDARLAGVAALLLAVLFALPPLHRALGAAAPRSVMAFVPGSVLAIAATAVMSFVGLRHGPALATVALAGFAFGMAFDVLARGRGPLRATAALLACASLAGAAVALTCYGARSRPFEAHENAPVEIPGGALTFRGAVAPVPALRRMLVDLRHGADSTRFVPQLVAGGPGVLLVRPAARMLAGPVVAGLALQQTHGGAHPVVWLRRGDTLRVGDATLRFARFRVEGGDTIRFYADLDVTRAGTTTRVSPGMAAVGPTRLPFAAQVPGVGPVTVARIDADSGRVALMVPQATRESGISIAILRYQVRPGLAAAWAALALGFLAFGLARRRTSQPG